MATDKVDMSLDDIIRQQRGPRGGGRGRGGRRGGGGGYSGNRAPRGGFGGGGGRRFGSPGTGGGGGVVGGGVQKPRGARRPVYTRGDIDGKWQHDLYRSDLVTPVASARDNNSRLGKLLISNLDFGVSDSDITELFTEFGPLLRAAVHYDRSGRSLGTAEVMFEMRADAVKAQQQYDNVPLDGRPMKIQLVGSESTSQTTSRPRPLMDRIDGGGRQNFGQRGRGRGRGRGGRGGGRDGSSGKSSLTKEQLDAQLDEYKMDVN